MTTGHPWPSEAPRPRPRAHREAASEELLDDLGIPELNVEQLVFESIEFLLDREPASAILGEFMLEQIPQYFPDYYDEVRRRIAAG